MNPCHQILNALFCETIVDHLKKESSTVHAQPERKELTASAQSERESYGERESQVTLLPVEFSWTGWQEVRVYGEGQTDARSFSQGETSRPAQAADNLAQAAVTLMITGGTAPDQLNARPASLLFDLQQLQTL